MGLCLSHQDQDVGADDWKAKVDQNDGPLRPNVPNIKMNK